MKNIITISLISVLAFVAFACSNQPNTVAREVGPGRGGQGDPCAATDATEAASAARMLSPREGIEALSDLRNFRNVVLAPTPEGRDLIGQFYRFDRRVIFLFSKDEKLRSAAARFIVQTRPLIRAINENSDRVRVTAEQAQSTAEFFEMLAAADERNGATKLAAEIHAQLNQKQPSAFVGLTAREVRSRFRLAE